MAASPKKIDKTDKVFDVAKPGKTAASASSRPLIIGHKPILKDPMVNDASVSEVEQPASAAPVPVEPEDSPSGSPPLPTTPDTSSSTQPVIKAPSEAKRVIQPLDSTVATADEEPTETDDDSKVDVNVGARSTDEAIAAEPDAADSGITVVAKAAGLDESDFDEPNPEPESEEPAKATEPDTAPEPQTEAKADKPKTEDASLATEKDEPKADEPVKIEVKKTKPDKKPPKTAKAEPVKPVESEPEQTEASKDTEQSEPAQETDSQTTPDKSSEESKDTPDESETTDSKPADSVPDSNSDKSTEKTNGEQLDPEMIKKAEQAAKIQAAKDQEVEKLVASQKYFVPIGEKTRRKRSLRRALTGALLILLLGGVLTYLMADVGIIKTSYKLPYEIFKDNAVIVSDPAPAATAPTAKPAAPTSKIFKSKVDGFSFEYPTKYELATLKEGAEESITLVPEKVTDNKILYYMRLPIPSSSKIDDTSQIADVRYFDTAFEVNDKPVYIRSVLVKNVKSGKYFIVLSLTDTKGSEKEGDNLKGDTLYPTFLAKDKKTRIKMFGRFVSLGTLEEAREFFSSKDYAEYMKILLSAKY